MVCMVCNSILKSQLATDELARLQNASQKVYFAPPEQEISTIATSLSNDSSEKKNGRIDFQH